MTYTSCSGCYQRTEYNTKAPDTYSQSQSRTSSYMSNGTEPHFAPTDAYALTGKEYKTQ